MNNGLKTNIRYFLLFPTKSINCNATAICTSIDDDLDLADSSQLVDTHRGLDQLQSADSAAEDDLVQYSRLFERSKGKILLWIAIRFPFGYAQLKKDTI